MCTLTKLSRLHLLSSHQFVSLSQTIVSKSAAMSSPDETMFSEEPLFLSGEQGFGFFPARPGLLLNDGRYEVLRKLGRGQLSSTWLASDFRAEERLRYRAIKILTVHATEGQNNGHLFELEVMKVIRRSKGVLRLPLLHDHFEVEGPHGRHLCMVQSVLSTDVSNFRCSAPTKKLGSPAVKIIVAEVLEGLRNLHAAQIIHTDLKPENVFFTDGTAKPTIDELLDESPIMIDGEFELNGVRYPLVRSQPIPHPFKWNDTGMIVEQYTFCLAGLGHAQWADRERTTRIISPHALRAPEIILGIDFDTKVDIWSLGCMTFELLTGQSLFTPQGGQAWSIEDDHLRKMMELMGETFCEAMLARSRNREKYFNEDGKLLRINQLSELVTLEQVLINHDVSDAEAAAFIRACLRLNPAERSSASDLETHAWLEMAFMC